MAIEADRSTLRRLLTVVARRRWLVIAVVIAVPLIAVLGSLLQEKRFQASSQVLLTRDDLAADLRGAQETFRDPERLAATRAQLARNEDLAAMVLRAAGRSDRPPAALLAASSVVPRPDTDIIVFRVTDRYRDVAATLATEYARQFTRFISQIDTAPLVRAQRALEDRLRELEVAGQRGTRVYSALTQSLDQLRVLRALNNSKATLVRAAESASLVQPRPVRSGVIGLVLGLGLALGLAFLREALDTRVRTGEEVSAYLGLPLLARLPTPPRREDLVMLSEPTSPAAEPYRVLRTNLEFVVLEKRSGAIMLTSAAQAEGKSTTAANLAIVLARSGRRVVLMDLDLRRPTLDRFFDATGRPGLTDVALGHVDLEGALLDVPLDGDDSSPVLAADGGLRRLSQSDGRLEVLTTGPLPPDPGGFIGSAALTEVLDALRPRADIVIVDTPPVLPVGDAMTLSAKLDGIVIVSRLNLATRPMLVELRRQLEASPAAKLGLVVSQAEAEGGADGAGRYAYSYSYQPERAGRDSRPEPEVHPEPEVAEVGPRRRQPSPYPTAADAAGAAKTTERRARESSATERADSSQNGKPDRLAQWARARLRRDGGH